MSAPTGAIRRVLFVCTANICRSAYAEVTVRHLLAEVRPGPDSIGPDSVGATLEVTSAGTHGWSDHPMDPAMAAEAAHRGADPGPFRSRPLTRTLVDEADLVLTAEAAHRTFVLQERPVAVARTFSLGQLAAALDDVPPDAAGKDLLRAARRARATASVDDDVADPYRRGPEAAAAAAEHLDRLLARILPWIAAQITTQVTPEAAVETDAGLK